MRISEEFVSQCVDVGESRSSENGIGRQKECGSHLCASAGLEQGTRLNAAMKTGSHSVCSKSIARLEDVPERHLWITYLIARGIARSERKNSAASHENKTDACNEDLLLHDYLRRAYKVIQNTGYIEELALMEKLVQGKTTKPKKKMTVDEIEGWIAAHEFKRLNIYQQLVVWENDGQPSQASEWAKRARKALAGTDRKIRFGYKIRLMLLREA